VVALQVLLPEAALPIPPIPAANATIQRSRNQRNDNGKRKPCAGCRTCVSSPPSPGATGVFCRLNAPSVGAANKDRLGVESSNGLSIAVRLAYGETGVRSIVHVDSAPPPSPQRQAHVRNKKLDADGLADQEL